MCGIAGIYNLNNSRHDHLTHHLNVMNDLQRHRGPDGDGAWAHSQAFIGLSHVRLSIIDLDSGQQPMLSGSGNVLTFNGEIYNYVELREQLKGGFQFQTNSDTEVILAAYEKWGEDCVNHFRGMFAFAIWDEKKQKLFCARDRFGIKPFYYTIVNNTFYFASESKALLPFIDEVSTDVEALKDYLAFQFTLGEKTLFAGIKQLLPAHTLSADLSGVNVSKYWEVYYNIDWEHSENYFVEEVDRLLHESVDLHLRADVPVGAYVSGGIDSSIMGALACKKQDMSFAAFTGKFSYGEGYDESQYARDLAKQYDMSLYEVDITSHDFIDNIKKVIYHLDTPIAGPGSFPQFMVSKLASKHRKVVLGGQGGDEIFGGYARYLLAYFEQCIKGALDGTLHDGNFVVTYESIIPNLRTLEQYKPLIKQFWSKGLFESIDQRYFQLIDRAPGIGTEINWDLLKNYHPRETFDSIFNGSNVGKESYFDKMTHFDFKTLLPALLQVEDRMSMAHGLESRVPFLDHPLIEFAATIPADVKFKDGKLKRLLNKAFKHVLPTSISERKDKMGFPVPLNEWMKGDLREFVGDVFNSAGAKNRVYYNSDVVLKGLDGEGKFSRKTWGLLSLELWKQQFHDDHYKYKKLITQ